jgi:hypothetical protein
MALLLAVGALAAAQLSATKKPPLSTRKVKALARRTARALGDTSVRTALVLETRHRQAMDVLSRETDPRSDPRTSVTPWVFVIIIRGHFVCNQCPTPPGAKVPRGRVAFAVWSPYWGTMDSGLGAKLPRYLARLGRPITIQLHPR